MSNKKFILVQKIPIFFLQKKDIYFLFAGNYITKQTGHLAAYACRDPVCFVQDSLFFRESSR